MSKIYRRPMFRGGGKVSSYGTGIASGLADGGMPDKRGLVDGPGGYAGEQFGGFVNKVPQAAYDSGRAVTGGSIMRGLGFNLPTFYASLVAGAPAALAYLNRAKTDEGLKYMKSTDPSVFDETAMEGEMEAYSEGFIKANEQGKPISFADNFFLDPETGTYPKFMGRTGDREKLAAIAAAEENIDDFEDYGEAANLEKGERALDAVMRTALERKKRKEDINDLLNNSTNGEIEKDTRSAKEQILENKKLFEEVMGGGKSAMIDDLSTMGLSFAGKALKEGATTKSAFSEFFEEESKRPSRKAKVSDAASNAAIQAYLTGEKSYNDLMKALKVNQAAVDYKIKRSKDSQTIDSLLSDYAKGQGSDRTDEGVMQSAYNELYGGGTFKGKLPEDQSELVVGSIYYADDPNNSRTKIIFLIDEEGNAQEINRVLK